MVECCSDEFCPKLTPSAAVEIYGIWDSPDDDHDVHELIDSIPFLGLQEIKEEDDDASKIVDIDAGAELDSSLCAEIFKNLRSMEKKKNPIADYVKTVQTQIDSRSRALCVDLIIEAAETLRCVPSAPHLAVCCVDRYLSGNDVDFKNLRCISLTSLMIASICDGAIPDFDFNAYTSLFDGIISRREFAESKSRILKYLNYDVMAPTAYSFLHRFIRAAQCGRHAPLRKLESMALYIAEASLLSTDMLRFPPSMVAASSVLLAQYVLDPCTEPWNPTLRHYTMYEFSDLSGCVSALLDLWCDESLHLLAITKKYCKEEYGCVAMTTFPRFIPLHVFDKYEIKPFFLPLPTKKKKNVTRCGYGPPFYRYRIKKMKKLL